MFREIRAQIAADIRENLVNEPQVVLTHPDASTQTIDVIYHEKRLDKETYRDKYLDQPFDTITLFKDQVPVMPKRGAFVTLSTGKAMYLETIITDDATKLVVVATENGGA